MVWIHGGGFFAGSASPAFYGPEHLLDHDIILVSINYRVGPLSFLTLENDELPGNLALRDQILALEWIQENIKYFGGDPDKVTIAGEYFFLRVGQNNFGNKIPIIPYIDGRIIMIRLICLESIFFFGIL